MRPNIFCVVVAAAALVACSGGIQRGTRAGGRIPSGPSPTEGYLITAYYTAVESFHLDAAKTVRGCPSSECRLGGEVLGAYPESFIAAVHAEGAGRITSGTYAGKYLNWSHDVGFWLDAIPANAYGGALAPFQTAAADVDVLARGTRFKLVAPLVQDDGTPLDSAAAARLLAAEWDIQDQFTPGSGGPRHLDLFVGEEDRPSFTTTSPLFTTLAGVRIIFR